MSGPVVKWAHRLPAAMMLLWACCSTVVVTRQAYRHGRVAYQVGPLTGEWRQVRFGDEDLVFRHRDGGTIAAKGSCAAGSVPIDDLPLAVLTNHLLFGISIRQDHGHTLLTLDGRQALRTHLVGELDGVPIELDLVVMKKDGCIYDLQLIAAPHEFARRQSDFDAFVQGFASVAGTQR
jgi:hypothetical protein